MCSLLLGNNKPNPHSKWGNAPQNAENISSQPRRSLFRAEARKSGKNRADPPCLTDMGKSPASSPICFIGRGAGRQKSTAVELLLHAAGPGKGAAWPRGTRPERGKRGHERENSGAWRVAPKNQALPSGALPGGKCINAHRERYPIHKKDRGEGGRLLEMHTAGEGERPRKEE